MGDAKRTLLFLVYLVVHLASLLLASASQRQPKKFVSSALVLLTELIKLVSSLAAIAGAEGSILRPVWEVIFARPVQLLRVCVPALLYAVQNNLIYASLAHLDAITFQITYQLKIAASLISTRLLLGRSVSNRRWLAVALLTLGVVLVQYSELSGEEQEPIADADKDAGASAPKRSDIPSCSTDPMPSTQETNTAAALTSERSRRNVALGFLGILIACTCSGLGGATMELLLKEGAQSLPRRNLQMAFVSVLIGLIKMFSDRQRLRDGGLFQGFSKLVWAMIALDSANGLMVSALLKYTSVVLKNFAAPLGIICNFLISRYILGSGREPNRQFFLGSILVLLALGMYSTAT